MSDTEKALAMIFGKVLGILIALGIFRLCGFKLTRTR